MKLHTILAQLNKYQYSLDAYFWMGACDCEGVWCRWYGCLYSVAEISEDKIFTVEHLWVFQVLSFEDELAMDHAPISAFTWDKNLA